MENDMINEAEIKDSDLVEIDNCLYKVCKSICKIIAKKKCGSGFLIKLYKENKPFYCLMTNEHVIDKQMVELHKKIEIFYDNEFKRLEIELNENERFIRDYRYMNIDLTIIEILEKDNINEDYYLLPDLEYINGYDQYKNKEIYIPQFPGGGKLSSSRGKIKTINNFIFSHLASTKPGSSIFLKDTIKVIGIHKAGRKDNTENYGNFIGPIIESLKRNYKYDKKYYDKEIYEGEFKNNVKEGFGKLIFEDGDYYIGEFLNDKIYGKGVEYNKNGKIIYEGDFINGNYEGKGKFIFEDDDYYIGEFFGGMKHGKGIEYYKNGNIKYEGVDKE